MFGPHLGDNKQATPLLLGRLLEGSGRATGVLVYFTHFGLLHFDIGISLHSSGDF